MTNPSSNHPSQPNAEIRKHYYLDQYAIIAPRRNLRPEAFGHPGEPHKIPNDTCPFCHIKDSVVWQTPKGKDWQVKVIKNAYPALTTDNPKSFGVQEVVINTPRHDLEFSELTSSGIKNVFEAYRARLSALAQLDGIRYVLVFKNDGPMAGASVAHAHCQIFGLPLIPPQIEREADALNHYWDQHQTCAVCDLIAWETKQKMRVIAEDKHMIAVAPYASSYAFEVWLLPRRHVGKFTDFTQSELESLAIIIKNITSRLDNHSMSFNYFLQESLPNQDHHFLLKVEPRTTKWAGAELGTGVIINPVTPEYATLWYRGKL